jgi:hypothetical protein
MCINVLEATSCHYLVVVICYQAVSSIDVRHVSDSFKNSSIRNLINNPSIIELSESDMSLINGGTATDDWMITATDDWMVFWDDDGGWTTVSWG